MEAYYKGNLSTIYHGDCRELSLENITALVTDPPYELGFMGKAWDQKGVSFQIETWQHLRGLCLSGAPLLSFGGTRTFHRIACAIEDAGWEIRDTIMWVYGSGFPKSLDIGKAVDKLQGNERELVGVMRAGKTALGQGTGWNAHNNTTTPEITKGTSVWEGYGTALKPAYEPIILGMNPLDSTFAENALKHKVAGLNIDGCRIPYQSEQDKTSAKIGFTGAILKPEDGWNQNQVVRTEFDQAKGRFPANFIHDGSQLVLELFPDNAGAFAPVKRKNRPNNVYGKYATFGDDGASFRDDNGSAARFFYCAKASKAERNAGCEGLPETPSSSMPGRRDPYNAEWDTGNDVTTRFVTNRHNTHPTVKPLALMEYLVKLVKMPEYNLVLDPFMGSGTTLLACIKLGIPCIGIDNDEHTCEIAAHRCENIKAKIPQMG